MQKEQKKVNKLKIKKFKNKTKNVKARRKSCKNFVKKMIKEINKCTLSHTDICTYVHIKIHVYGKVSSRLAVGQQLWSAIAT